MSGSLRSVPPASQRRLRDVRIGTKLALILIVPVLAVLGLGGYLVAVTSQQADRATTALALTELAQRSGDLSFALELERAASAALLLPAAGAAEREAYSARVAETDAVLGSFAKARAGVNSEQSDVSATLVRVDSGVRDLTGLREFVTTAKGTTWSAAVLRYRLLIADLLALRQAPALAGLPAELADQVRAMAALSQAVEFIGLQHAAVVRATAADRLTPAGLQAIVAARTGFEETRQTFVSLARPEWRSWWDTGVAGQPVVDTARMDGVVGQTRLDEQIALDPGAWTTATVAQMALMHGVQVRVDSEVLAAVRAERDQQVRTAIIAGSLVAVVLIVATAVAARVARTMARRLRLLREGALLVAHHQLPEVVARLAEPRGFTGVTPQQVVESTRIPVTVDGTDEIGEVAAAFATVSREAVRHAADQAFLRAHVAAMFVAMARRLQHLTDAMMRQLDTLERTETDDTRLAGLFALDHVGTRIGRYTDSLLVVSGTSSSRRRTTPVDLLDVLRAAAGQVEAYTRVQYGVIDSGVAVAAHIVDHVVHALAELIDNACAFSPPELTVIVEGRRIGADTLIEVTDRGIGLSPAALADVNARLAEAPRMDARSLRSIGIATVAAIAGWHGLRVTLVRAEDGGTTARMLLPPEVTIRAPRHLHPKDTPPPLWQMVPRLLERSGTMLGGVPWTRSQTALPVGAAAPSPAESAQPVTPAFGHNGWAAPAGWGVAAAAARVQPAGTNSAGLPVRNPMAQLVPGGFGAPEGYATTGAGPSTNGYDRADYGTGEYDEYHNYDEHHADGAPYAGQNGSPHGDQPTYGPGAGGPGGGASRSRTGTVRRDAHAVSAAMRSYQLGLMQGRAGSSPSSPRSAANPADLTRRVPR